jgi:secondary thiamine-phosphate synthase enzyme
MCENSAMSRSSSVTARETPIEQLATVTTGTLVVHGEVFTVESNERIQLIDLTDRMMTFARKFSVREGMLTLWSTHTTCALFVNESQPALLADITRFLQDVVASDRYYLHNDPKHSDCDRMNADAHLRATLLGHSLTVQISGGELVLGQWQRILLAELDGPRTRTLRAQLWGVQK